MTEPRFAFATETRDKNENQDGGVAERLLMADGTFAYLACVADGVSQCESPREVAAMAISALRRAIESSTAAILADPSDCEEWIGNWSSALASTVKSRVEDGFSTLCALILFRLPDEHRSEEAEWGLVSINVGDSQAFLVSPGLEGCISLKPDEGKRHNSAPGGGLARAVGMPGSPLFDACLKLFPAEFSGWFWVGSDGVFNFVMGSDLRSFCLSGDKPFRKLPDAVLDLSLSEGRASNKKKLDNATVAVLGLNVPEGAEATPDFVPPPPPPAPRRWPLYVLLAVLIAAVSAALALAGRSLLRPRGGADGPRPSTVRPRQQEGVSKAPNLAPPDNPAHGGVPELKPPEEPTPRVVPNVIAPPVQPIPVPQPAVPVIEPMAPALDVPPAAQKPAAETPSPQPKPTDAVEAPAMAAPQPEAGAPQPPAKGRKPRGKAAMN